MANTLSVMTNVLRNVVSKQRRRYKEKGFNLDLAYICDNIIAMGYPADNIESIYRNRIEDVYNFFEAIHPQHYKIYNLCSERSYDSNKFHGRVAVYPFDDHNPPTIELIQQFCQDVDSWLKVDVMNVAAIHCKAGKGRTGTMICCYLLYSGFQNTAEDALAYYDEKRTKDRKGVTIPSQRRYVQYFSRLIESRLIYQKKTLQLCEIRFSEANVVHSQSSVYCSISILHNSNSVVQALQTIPIDFRKSLIIDLHNLSLYIAGDVKVELFHKTSRKKIKIFHFWFNTFFVCDSAEIEKDELKSEFIYTLLKSEIDDAHKDKEHKFFSEEFKVQLLFLAPKLSSSDIVSGGVIPQSCRTEKFDLEKSLHNQAQISTNLLNKESNLISEEKFDITVDSFSRSCTGSDNPSSQNSSSNMPDIVKKLGPQESHQSIVNTTTNNQNAIELSSTEREFMKSIVYQPQQHSLPRSSQLLLSPINQPVSLSCKSTNILHNNGSHVMNNMYDKQQQFMIGDDFRKFWKKQQNQSDLSVSIPSHTLELFEKFHRSKTTPHKEVQQRFDCKIFPPSIHPDYIYRKKSGSNHNHKNHDSHGIKNAVNSTYDTCNTSSCSNSSYSSQSSPSAVGDEEDWESGESTYL